MSKKILGFTLVAGGLVLSAGAQASVIVDDFSADSVFITASDSDTTTLGASSDFSTDRVLSITENPTGPGGATAVVFGNELGISTGFQTGSDTTSAYSNAAGFDFTEIETSGSIFEAFVLGLISIDQGGVDITLTVDGVSVMQSANTIGEVFFAHADFNGVDFTSVNSIDLDIHNNVAVDATFAFFESRGSEQGAPPPIGVPEPTTLALMGFGLFGLGYGRRKSKS